MTLGGLEVISRPQVAFPRNEPVAGAVSILTRASRLCVRNPCGGTTRGGSEKDSKNTLYGAEVLSQLYYRAKVDEMRVEWEKVQGKKFEWVVSGSTG